jgi:hypothetical protein
MTIYRLKNQSEPFKVQSPADVMREAMREGSGCEMPPNEAQQHVAKVKRMIDEMRAHIRSLQDGQLELLPEL